MDNRTIETIENIIGYKFNNKQLLIQAFTRQSYSIEHPEVQHNEVLEFYGDSALGIVIVKSMCKKFSKIKNKQFISEKDEGDLTQIKSSWVDKKQLAHTIKVLGLEQYIRLGNSDLKNNARETNSVKEDLCEALIGAVAIDCDWDFNILYKLCSGMLDVTEFSENTIRILAQWCKSNGYKIPTYSKFTPKENPIANKFYQQVKIPELKVNFIGWDDTVTEAKMQAAFKAIKHCKKIDMKKDIGEPNINTAISQLNELFHKDYIERPSYVFTEKNSQWECVCKVPHQNDIISLEKTKKEAKRKSSLKMLNQITDLTVKE